MLYILGCWSVITLANTFPVSVLLSFQSRPEGGRGWTIIIIHIRHKSQEEGEEKVVEGPGDTVEP